jgi:hypothetical protein
LNSLHEENPKLYWNIVNELQGKSEKSGLCLIILLLILSRPGDLLLSKCEIGFDSSFSIII